MWYRGGVTIRSVLGDASVKLSPVSKRDMLVGTEVEVNGFVVSSRGRSSLSGVDSFAIPIWAK